MNEHSKRQAIPILKTHDITIEPEHNVTVLAAARTVDQAALAWAIAERHSRELAECVEICDKIANAAQSETDREIARVDLEREGRALDRALALEEEQADKWRAAARSLLEALDP